MDYGVGAVLRCKARYWLKGRHCPSGVWMDGWIPLLHLVPHVENRDETEIYRYSATAQQVGSNQEPEPGA